MALSGDGGALLYTPSPDERDYYNRLFVAADTNRSGSIGGQEAVAFFSRSKLPIEQLKNVWTVADSPPSNSLNLPKFSVAIRLIQLLQNGVKGQGSNLSVAPGTVLRPVFLEGISGAVVPMPSKQQSPSQEQNPPSQRPEVLAEGHAGQVHSQRQHEDSQTPAHQAEQQAVLSSGGMPSMVPQPPSGGSRALTVQDPYTLTPSERSRYESLFPDYAKEDGYMHGKEAVHLFSKSGLSQTQLRDIWNMADQPVDNKLDRLEFSIAMHLIVCISKKNLPMPKTLPFSLKTLKQNQQQQPLQQEGPPSDPRPGVSTGTANVYTSGREHTLPNRTNVPLADESVTWRMTGMAHPNTQGQPAPAKAGGMNISDAFEGLSARTGADAFPPSKIASAGSGGGAGLGMGGGNAGGEPLFGDVTGGTPASSVNLSSKAEPTLKPTSVPSAPFIDETPQPVSSDIAGSNSEPVPMTAQVLAQSYIMSDSAGELVKLKTVLQKLQAENISLKAQLSTMSDEENDVLRQLNATVAEVGELSNRLATLRAQVLASKSRLLAATAKLKAAQEKKGVLNDMIDETVATKEAIETVCEGIDVTADLAQAPPQSMPAFEAGLFGIGSPAEPSPNLSEPHQPRAAHDEDSFPAQDSGPHQNHIEALKLGERNELDTVSNDSPNDVDANRHVEQGQQRVLLAECTDPAQEPATQTYGQGLSAPRPPTNAFLNQGAANVQQVGSCIQENAQQGISFERSFRPNPLSMHNKQGSVSSNLSFEVMGGLSVPQNQFAHDEKDDFNGEDTCDSEPAAAALTMEEIHGLRSKAKDAEDLARDSEGTLRQLMAHADKLRRAADNAEVQARQKIAEASEKKGGFMSGGKKKRTMKEATQAKHDAEAKKKAFLVAQSQANDAQAVAMETKREAEVLRKQAEQAELDLAAAASMEHRQPVPEPVPAPATATAEALAAAHAPEPPMSSVTTNGGFPQQGLHGQRVAIGGYGQGLVQTIVTQGKCIPAYGHGQQGLAQQAATHGQYHPPYSQDQQKGYIHNQQQTSFRQVGNDHLHTNTREHGEAKAHGDLKPFATGQPAVGSAIPLHCVASDDDPYENPF